MGSRPPEPLGRLRPNGGSLYVGERVDDRVGLPRLAVPWTGIGAVMSVRFQCARLINEHDVADISRLKSSITARYEALSLSADKIKRSGPRPTPINPSRKRHFPKSFAVKFP